MKCARLLVFMMLAWPQHGLAQEPSNDGLTEQQRTGRRVLAQSCGVCHLPPAMRAQTYGPPLHKSSATGDETVMRTTIMEGTTRMPAFKYYLQPNEVDAIIAYLKTIPAPAPAPAPAK